MIIRRGDRYIRCYPQLRMTLLESGDSLEEALFMGRRFMGTTWCVSAPPDRTTTERLSPFEIVPHSVTEF